MINECSTDRVCRCCGEPYSEHRPKSYAVPGNCAWCVYEAKFQIKPDAEVKFPEGLNRKCSLNSNNEKQTDRI